MGRRLRAIGVAVPILPCFGATASLAALSYSAETTAEGFRYVVVAGEFEHRDDLERFSAVVKAHAPAAVTFASGGGNVFKAMELGRLIRSYGLNTAQLRSADCSSACALAFLGGVARFAEPGAIGVHKSSFSNIGSVDAAAAVSAVQQMTAEVIGYIVEMGADPALLELSLRYESNDVRYLSGSEMRRYRVVAAAMVVRAVGQ